MHKKRRKGLFFMEITNQNGMQGMNGEDLINQPALDAMDSNCPSGSQSYRVCLLYTSPSPRD